MGDSYTCSVASNLFVRYSFSCKLRLNRACPILHRSYFIYLWISSNDIKSSLSRRSSKMRGSPWENFETSLIMADKSEIKMKKDRYSVRQNIVEQKIWASVQPGNGRSANPFVNRADRIEKEISELRRRVHARKNKKMTAADRGRLLYSIQLLFRLDGINFKKRFKERFSRKTN